MTLALKAILSLDARGFAQAAAASGERLRDLKGQADVASAGLATLSAASDRATQSQAVATAADQKRTAAQQQLVKAQRDVTAAQAALSQVNDDTVATAKQLADADLRRRQALDQVAAAQAGVTAAQARLTAANDEAERVHRTLFEAEQARRQALEGLRRIQVQSAAAAQREVEVLDLMRDAVRNATTADLGRAQALEARIRQAREGAVAELQAARAVAQATGDYRALAEAARNLQGVQGQLTAVQSAQAAIVRQIRDQYVPLEAVTRQYEATVRELDAAERAGILTDKEAAAARTQAITALRQAEAAHRRQGEAATQGARGVQLAAHEAANLSYQIQDTFVQLASGQNPLMILIQQGPQAAGAVGGVTNLLKLLVSPIALAAGATIALGAAFFGAASYISGLATETRAYETRLAALNPQLDLSIEKYRAMAKEIAAARTVAKSDATAAIQRIIVVPTIRSADLVRSLAGLSQDLAAVLGGEVEGWAEKLAKAFGKGASGVRELDEQLGFLTAAQAENIRSLEMQGRQAEATAAAIKALEVRFGGAARDMKSQYDQAMVDMGNAWDAFLTRVFNEDVQARAGIVARAIASIFKALTPNSQAEDNLDQLISKMGQLAAAQKELREARATGALGIGVLERQVAALAKELEALQSKQAANPVERLAEGVPAVAAAVASTTQALGALTEQEQKRIGEARAELAKYQEGLKGVGLARQLAAAGAQAYYAEVERGGSAQAAEQQRMIAQQRVMAEYDASLRETALASRLQADAQLRLAEAAGKGEAAQRAASYANEIAAASARSAAEGALAVEDTARREAATVQRLATERVAGLTAQRQTNDNMTQAVLSGAEAVRIAQRAEYQLVVTREQGAAATDKIAEAMAAYDAALRSSDQLDWAKATAQQAVELQQVNSLLGVERANLTASNRQRALAISHQEALNELSRIGLGWTQQEREEWLRNADAIAAARVEAEELNRLRSTIDDVASDAADAVYDAMTGRGDSIVGWFKALWKRIAVEALKQQIMLPIVTQVIGSAPGLFGATGAGATAATGGLAGVANFIGGGGLASSISGLSNLVSGGFSLGSLFGGGGLSAGAASLKASLFGQAGIRGTATSGLFGSGGTAFGSTMAANGIAGAFSGLGTGMLAGQVLGMLGIGKGNTTGSAIGGALGGAIGSIVPGIGTLLGSIAGGALGSLFGAGPSDKEGSAVLNLGAGNYQVGGFTGKKYSQENRDAAANIADQVLTLKRALEGFGARITGTLAVGVGDRDGLFATGLNTTARTRFESSEAGAQQLLGFVAQQFVGAIGSQLPAEISTALGRVDWSDLEQAGGDVDFIKGFRDSLKALRGDFGLTDQVTAEATAAVQSQVKAIREFRDSATRLFPEAMGEVDSTLRQYVDGLIGVRNAAPAMTEVEAALSALEARWQAYIPLMQEVGYSTAEAQALMASGLAKAKDAARGDWVGQMDREYNSLIGNDYINQIRDLRTARDTQYRNADALGADRGIVDRNISAALNSILTTDLRPDQLQEAVRLFGTEFPEAAAAAQTALAALTSSVAQTGETAAEAAARIAATSALSDSLADRLARATGASDSQAGALAIFDRAAAQERATTQARINAGELSASVLADLETTLGQEREAIIRRFTEAAVTAEQQRQERLAQVNQSISDRLFNAVNDNSSLAGALAEFDRQAGRDRVEAARTAGADLASLDEAIAAERLAIIRRFGQQAAEITRSIEDREFARGVAGRADAEILLLERRQNAEFAAAIAAGYTTEQLERLRLVLAGEMTDAVNKLNDATRQTAAQARAAAQAVNDNLADRLFAATNDNSTLEGALAAFDRQAAKDRIETAQTAGADMLALERALAAERQAIITRFAKQAIDAENQRLAALSQAGGQLRQWIDGIRSGNGTPQANLDTIRAQYQQQLTLARGGNVDAVQGLREYAQRLIDAESARTASGADRRAMVEAILAQLETVPAVKSYDQQVLEALQALGGGISVDVDLAVIRTITEVLSALPDEARDQLIQAQTIVRAIEERLGRSLTPVELDSLVEGGQITRDIRQLLGRDLTSSERAALIQADSVERRVEQLLGRQLTAAEAATLIQPGSVQRLIGQQVGAATGASLVLPETVTRTVNQVLTIQGQVLSSQALSQQIAIELGNVQFQGQAVANRYLAAIAWNTARMVGAGGEGLLITDDPAQAGDQTLREQRAAATLSVSGGGGNTDNGGIIAASDRIAAKIADLHAWQVQVWAVQSGLLDKTKYNTAETSKKLGGGYAYAGGTDFHPGGWARVGEEGEEFINLPRGAQVFNRAQTLELARQPRTMVVGVAGGGGNDNRALTAAIERQARALERQNTLLEKIAANSAAGADAAVETAKALKTPARVRVGTVAKMAGGRS